MPTVLIADRSEAFSASLAEAFHKNYEVHVCNRGDTALESLKLLRPDVLIINLTLPYMDGLSVLRSTEYTPPVILALIDLATDYVLQALKDAGVDYCMLIPCTARAVKAQIESMLRLAQTPREQPDPQTMTCRHLDILGIPSGRNGYLQLRVGVPLFAQDPRQALQKELYSAIAAICGNDNTNQVESSMRTVIHDAWEHRDPAVWETYFPSFQKAPSNRKFLAVLARKL